MFGSEGYTLLLPENWLTRDPVEYEKYASIVMRIGKAWNGNVFAGAAYTLYPGSRRPRSTGLAYIEGNVVNACEKVFPSKAVGERGRLEPGRLLDPVNVGSARIACIVCVDIFYPEVARAHALRGATILYNPASIPTNRVNLWRSVLATRAVENTVYTIGVNSVGIVYPDGRLTGGGSTAYSPIGEAVQAKIHGPLRLLELDPKLVDTARERWAFYEDLAGGLAPRIFPGTSS